MRHLLTITYLLVQSIPYTKAQTNDSVRVDFGLYNRDGTSYTHCKAYVIDNNKAVAYYYTGERSSIHITVPKSAYKNPNATLIILHPVNKQKDVTFNLRKVSHNISYSKDGDPIESSRMCNGYWVEVETPLIDVFNPSNRTFTSDEIEKMPR